jgi:hypothetical protein
MGNTPTPDARWLAFYKFVREHRVRAFVSIEPVMAFDVLPFADGLLELKDQLDMVYIGYDNYKCKLPEPPLRSVALLGERLKKGGVRVSYKTLRERWDQ